MKLYNTLTRKTDEVTPLSPPTVTVYTCGPTVYDYPHIGNWFTYIREDLLIRSLKASGLKPSWVMNITDVGHLVSDADEGEDKLEKGARREGKTAWDVAKRYTDYFVEGLHRLNILMPDELPRATDHIAEQIELIKTLEAKGFTYVISDGVYFDTSKFPAYADFARLDLDEQEAGKRVDFNPEKRNVADFALWKFSPRDHQRDMEWDSPWGTGFPGWHIECSAMSMKYLGTTLDIHAGGIDHVPVHHTNEIAQSEAATGQPFAQLWMHSNHITIEGEKISKSLGNGITLEDIEAKGISLEAFRLHVLESHYRSQSKFSWDSLEAAQNRLRAYRAMATRRWQVTDNGGVTPETIANTRQAIEAALFNDLDTPAALAALSQLEAAIDSGGISASSQDSFLSFLQWLDSALGLTLTSQADITPAQQRLVAAREQARNVKDWAESDRLRDELANQGLAVRDTAQGAIWHRL
jgi:cysteinyl-tRNA synthetase